MKKTKIVCNVFAMLMAFSGLTACGGRENGGEKIDSTKSILNIGVMNDGVGDAFLYEIEKDFEAYYANKPYEDGKMGVEIVIESKKDEFKASTLLEQMPFYENTVWFAQMDYNAYVNKGLLVDMTDIMSEKIYDENGDMAADTNKTATQSILDIMYDEYVDAFNNSGKYYALPFRYNFNGITYDADLFNEQKLYMLKNGQFGANQKNIDEGNCSVGPDGKMGTSDDGMPTTYTEFIELLDYMKNKGITPFTWCSQTDYQERMAYEVFWANYEGANDYALNFSFNGTDSQFGEITEDDYGVLVGQEGRKAALKFAKDVASYPAYYSSKVNLQGFTAAQQEYAYSMLTDKRIAMFFEGSYWESEARAIFDEMGLQNPKLGYGKRDFRWLPIPNFKGVDGVADQTKADDDRVLVANDCYKSGVYIAAQNTCKNKDVQLKIAKDFIQFIHQRKQLANFTKNTGGAFRPFDFDVSTGEMADWPGVARSIKTQMNEGATVVSSFPISMERRNNLNGFSEGAWTFRYTMYNDPFTYWMNYPNKDLNTAFNEVTQAIKSSFTK